jgi:hypothetical protein
MSDEFRDELGVIGASVVLGAMAFVVIVLANVMNGKAPGKTWESWKPSVIMGLIVTVALAIILLTVCFKKSGDEKDLVNVLEAIAPALS